jgi:hypothetical protein
MPQASPQAAAQIKYWLKDHDTATVDETPPVQNQWYTIFETDDVRLLWFTIEADDVLFAGSDLQIRLTCDGNIYLINKTVNSGNFYYVYRHYDTAVSGTSLVVTNEEISNAAFGVDKRALHMKAEIRKTSACLATDNLMAWCVYETLEAT